MTSIVWKIYILTRVHHLGGFMYKIVLFGILIFTQSALSGAWTYQKFFGPKFSSIHLENNNMRASLQSVQYFNQLTEIRRVLYFRNKPSGWTSFIPSNILPQLNYLRSIDPTIPEDIGPVLEKVLAWEGSSDDEAVQGLVSSPVFPNRQDE
jgi:hypothetical protein